MHLLEWQQYSYSKGALDKAAEYCAKTTKDGTGIEPLYMLITKQQAFTMYDGNEVEAAKATFEALKALQKKEYGDDSVIVAEVKVFTHHSISGFETLSVLRVLMSTLRIADSEVFR